MEVKRVFTPNPIISFRSARKLSSYLVRTVGSYMCGEKRCEVCISVSEISSFASTETGETRCLVYFLTCSK